MKQVAYLSVAGAAALLVAGCGGRPGNHVASIGPTTTASGGGAQVGGPAAGGLGASLERYSACMRAHGVTGFPDPVLTPGGGVSLKVTPDVVGSPRFAPAQQACRSLLPARTGPPTFTAGQQADYLKAAQCMRAHGLVGFPDPVFAGGQVSFPLPAGMDASSTPFRAARVICEKLIPNGLPYSASSEGG